MAPNVVVISDSPLILAGLILCVIAYQIVLHNSKI